MSIAASPARDRTGDRGGRRLGVPTILFGVGTGELLDLMRRPRVTVMGIDWHVDLDEGRRRVGGARSRATSIRRAVSAASTPPSKARATCWREPATTPGTSSTSDTASCPRPIRRCSKRSFASCTTRARRAFNDDRAYSCMAYGTPSTPMTSRRTTREFVTAVLPPPNSSPTSTPLQRHRRHVAAGAHAAPTRWRASPRRSRTRPGGFDVRFGSKYEPPLLETPPSRSATTGSTSSWASSLAPHSSSMSTDQYMSRRRRRPSVTGSTSYGSARGGSSRDSSRSSPHESTTRSHASRRAPCTTEVIFSAHSLPEKILATGDTTPSNCARAPSAPPCWRASSAGTSRGSRPDEHPTSGSVPHLRSADKRAPGRDRRRCRVPLGSSATTWRCSSTSISKRRASLARSD